MALRSGRRIALLASGFPLWVGLLAGCGVASTNGPMVDPPAADPDLQRGVYEQYYFVNLIPSAQGTIVSSDGLIACGAGGALCGDENHQLRYAWSVASVTLTATPSAGHAFVGWAGDCTGTGPCALTRGADRFVAAAFAPTAAGSGTTLTVERPTGGTVSSGADRLVACGTAGGPGWNCGPAVVPGSRTVTLTATPDPGYTFQGWTGDCGGQGACVLDLAAGPDGRRVGAAFSGSPSSCRLGQHLEPGACAADVRSCPVTGGTGTQLWSDGAWGPCSAAVCAPDHHLDSGRCLPTAPPTYRVSGWVTGLAGTGLVLQLSGGEDRLVTSAGSFAFSTRLPTGAAYAVTVARQPTGPAQTCTVSAGQGVVGAADVESILVTCATDAYRLSGAVSGLAGEGLVLSVSFDGGPAEDVGVDAAGAFAFSQPGPAGASYAVTVKTQPSWPWQTCLVFNGTGLLAGPVTDLSVTCRTNAFRIGGAVIGLAGSGLVLATAGEPDLAVAAGSTRFAFAGTLPSGSDYAVRVVQQPTSPIQSCTVSDGDGQVRNGEITGVTVTCVTRSLVGGAISGLAGSGLTLASPGQPDLVVPAGATSFAFADRQPAGSTYVVTVVRQPADPVQACTVARGQGTILVGDVTDVAVSCITQRQIGGVVAGLLGSGLTLASPGQPNLEVPAGATTFTFAGRQAAGTSYAVTVLQQPGAPAQVCAVASGEGLVGEGDVASVDITCRSAWWKVDAGARHSVGIRPDGTLWAWGANDRGQLGDGTTTQRTSPVLVGTGYAAVTAGYDFTVALKTDGTLWAWGFNQNGELGDGTTTYRYAPVQIGTGYAAAVAGASHTVALKADGTLWAWGSGGVGDGTYLPRLEPLQLGVGFADVSAGGNRTVAVKLDGTLWSWGSSFVGDGTSLPVLAPVQVGTGFATASDGYGHTLAVKGDGALWSWGENGNGQVGDDSTAARLAPVLIEVDVAVASAGFWHSTALKLDGTLLAWGGNSHGELGDGTTTYRLLPVPIGTGFAAVSAGKDHTLAVKLDGSLWSWGSNVTGALGTGTAGPELLPAPVP